jgi:hypothetical protein
LPPSWNGLVRIMQLMPLIIHTCVKFKVSILAETKVTKRIMNYTYGLTDGKLVILLWCLHSVLWLSWPKQQIHKLYPGHSYTPCIYVHLYSAMFTFLFACAKCFNVYIIVYEIVVKLLKRCFWWNYYFSTYLQTEYISDNGYDTRKGMIIIFLSFLHHFVLGFFTNL